MIIISSTIKEQLRRLPEYGMGYQIANVSLNSGGIEKGIILNGEIFIKFVEVKSIPNLFSQYNILLAEARRSSLKVVGASIIERSSNEMHGVKRIHLQKSVRMLANKKQASPAKDAEDSYSLLNEVFKRFSAYLNDFRITEKKGLTPGTYATTAEDASNVKTGMEAVSRYALENKTPANKVFTIKPPEDTKLKRGIVEPAYGESGGGVEVIFVDGSPDGTVSGPEIIPER